MARCGFCFPATPRRVRLRRSTVFKVLPVFDPDGVAEGAVRFNANGYDNNRNWDAVDAGLMPEIAAAKRFWRSHRRLSGAAQHRVHRLREGGDRRSGYQSAGRPPGGAAARAPVSTTRSPRDSMAAPIDKGRATVNQDLFTERKLAAFLMELMVERHPDLDGRAPRRTTLTSVLVWRRACTERA